MTASIQRGETIAPATFGLFSADDLAAYAAASGDDNPLHLDPVLAEKAGLAAPPIQVLIILAQLSPYLRAWRPEAPVHKMTTKFVEPVLAGETFEVTGKVVQAQAGQPAVVRLTVRRGTAIVALAEAFVG